jgi:hypothetical protein
MENNNRSYLQPILMHTTFKKNPTVKRKKRKKKKRNFKKNKNKNNVTTLNPYKYQPKTHF